HSDRRCHCGRGDFGHALHGHGRLGSARSPGMGHRIGGHLRGRGAFYLAASRITVWSALLAAALFAAAIVALHFSGMAALTIAYDPRVAFNNVALSSVSLSAVMAGAAMSILALCLIAALIDWRTRERIQLQKLQLNTALENMSQGLCMFDHSGRAVLFNERYSEITGLPPERLKKATLLEIVQARKTGVKTQSPEEFAAQVMGAV